jgi:DNA-directed RNA polymerase subunit RPC12/RpoP
MHRYICPECGKHCYSAAELANMVNPRCPYCGKLGIKKAETKKSGGVGNLHLLGLRKGF